MNRMTTVQGNKMRAATEAVAVVWETPVEVNERGFMIDPSQWTPGAALYLARRQGLRDWAHELTSDHWRVIDYMRSYYEATGNAASLRYTCNALGLTKRQFSRLFPGGLMTARRISGLPGTRRYGNGRELSIAQQLMTRNWWERLTDAEFEDDAAATIAGDLSASPVRGRSSRRKRESGRSPKGRALSSAQQSMTRNWWERLTGAESEDDAAVGIAGSLSASPIRGRSSRRKRESGRSPKGRALSSAQQSTTRNWWKRLTGA
jgi:TusE/DsrC/DsvC family sulfur relay protein